MTIERMVGMVLILGLAAAMFAWNVVMQAKYAKERTAHSELHVYSQQLNQLHILIHSLLLTQNRDHLLEGMLGHLKSVIPKSACTVYLYDDGSGCQITKMERLAWYDEDDIQIPDNELALKSACSATPLTEHNKNGLESRRVSPIVFNSRTVGMVDLYKPLGLLPKELKMYQLLMEYLSSFWVLYNLVSVDALTGIWNRRYMDNRFQEEANRISRYGGNACVVVGDMGNFKQINDKYGHAKGDDVLIKVAQTLKGCLRVTDSVGRYGGDEFIMLLPNTSRLGTDVVLDRIKTEIGLLRINSGDDDVNNAFISVVVDFGTAVFPGEAPTLLDTIKLADEDMYVNKTIRKGQEGLSLPRDLL